MIELKTVSYITKICPGEFPKKTKNSCGNWVVFAETKRKNEQYDWIIPECPYYFFTKKRAIEFIEGIKRCVDAGENFHVK